MQKSLTPTPQASTIIPKFEVKSGGLAPKSDPDTGLSFLAAATSSLGVKNQDAAALLISQLVESNFKVTAENCAGINGLIAIVTEMNPQDSVEAMLISQMVTCSNQIMKFMKKITNSGSGMPSNPEVLNALLKLVDRLMRTYAVQVETLVRYRKKGEQRIIIERIDVNDGGQAIVGNIERGQQ